MKTEKSHCDSIRGEPFSFRSYYTPSNRVFSFKLSSFVPDCRANSPVMDGLTRGGEGEKMVINVIQRTGPFRNSRVNQ